MKKNIKNEVNINIPENIKIKLDEKYCYFSNKNGEIKHKINNNLIFKIENNIIKISLKDTDYKFFKKNYSLLNTNLALLKNYIFGLENFYEKILTLKGIGYKAEVKDNVLKLFIGFSKEINLNIPDNLNIEINSNTNIIIKSISKDLVGQFAAYIRNKRKPEPYKGNGIKYKNENIKLKTPKKGK